MKIHTGVSKPGIQGKLSAFIGDRKRMYRDKFLGSFNKYIITFHLLNFPLTLYSIDHFGSWGS